MKHTNPAFARLLGLALLACQPISAADLPDPDGETGKYPELNGNVATVYTHDMARGGSGNGHYGGDTRVYMDVGLAMGDAMLKLLNN